MKLPLLSDLDVRGKKVIVRGDLDVDIQKLQNSPAKQDPAPRDKTPKLQTENLRLESTSSTLKYLLDKGAVKIIILGHRGRPGGKEVKELSLEPLVDYFSDELSQQVSFVPFAPLSQLKEDLFTSSKDRVVLVENIRFWPEEEENRKELAEFFVRCADCYVNECFSGSHRNHMSFIELPKAISNKHSNHHPPSTIHQTVAAGLHFAKDVENLEKVRDNPKRPVIVIIGGAKEDKLKYIEPFKKFADKILVGGRLPEYLEKTPKIQKSKTPNNKVIVASLNQDKQDLTIHSIEKFEEEIEKAGTIVVAGPMGHFEIEGQGLGTQRVLEAVVSSPSFKVAGGGDTLQALQIFNLTERLDWVSVGGGAMLEFLAQGTLVGIEALQTT